MNKPSITSNRSKSSTRSIDNILEDLEQRLPRYEDIVYVMSIESDKSQGKNRGSDIMDRLDPQNRYSSSNRNSTEMAVQGERGGSFGTAGQFASVSTVPRMNSLMEGREDHSCDCYRRCLGRACNCFQFVQPCIEKRCCIECIEMKRRLLLEKEQREKQESTFIPQQPSTPVMTFLNQPSPVPQDFLFQPGAQLNIFAGMGQPQQQQRQPAAVHHSHHNPQHRFSHTPTAAHSNIAHNNHANKYKPQYQPISEEKTIYSESIEDSQQSRFTEQQSSCACKKTKCLKMYCQCFSRRGYCSPRCSCEECLNKTDSEARRQAIAENIKEQDKGCHCKKTKCEKKYCKCFAGGEKCTKFCTCENCNNMNEQLRLLRKRQSDLKMQPQNQQAPVYPVKELPGEIVFEMPDFSKLNIGGMDSYMK